MEWSILLIWIGKALIFFFLILTGCAYYTLAERKFAGFFQGRPGPNRAGPWGLFQPLADGIKFLSKEEIIPANVSKTMYLIAPTISMTCAILLWSVVPLGGTIPIPESLQSFFGLESIDLLVANPDTGVLTLMAISGLAVYGIMIAGWSSNNKYSLMGGIRATAQMISYEIPLGLSLVAIAVLSGSLRLMDINDMQKGLWNIFTPPGFIGFFIFLIAIFAETNRLPFDLAEAESELVVGFHTEYGAFKFALFFLAEYMNMITMSMVISLLFFGGYNVPFVILEGSVYQPILGIGLYVSKILFFAFFFIWVRWSLPRFRYDQLMRIGWKRLIPWSLFNVFFAAVYIMYIRDSWWLLFN